LRGFRWGLCGDFGNVVETADEFVDFVFVGFDFAMELLGLAVADFGGGQGGFGVDDLIYSMFVIYPPPLVVVGSK